MTLPVAGWYEDPQDATRLRWWDGVRWGAIAPEPRPVVHGATAPTWNLPPRPPAPSEYRVVHEEPLRGRKARVARDRATRAANPFGYAGLVLALVAFIFDLMAIPSILGVVFGAVGLARASQLTGQRVTGFGVSVAAIVLGLIAGGFFCTRAAALLG